MKSLVYALALCLSTALANSGGDNEQAQEMGEMLQRLVEIDQHIASAEQELDEISVRPLGRLAGCNERSSATACDEWHQLRYRYEQLGRELDRWQSEKRRIAENFVGLLPEEAAVRAIPSTRVEEADVLGDTRRVNFAPNPYIATPGTLVVLLGGAIITHGRKEQPKDVEAIVAGLAYVILGAGTVYTSLPDRAEENSLASLLGPEGQEMVSAGYRHLVTQARYVQSGQRALSNAFVELANSFNTNEKEDSAHAARVAQWIVVIDQLKLEELNSEEREYALQTILGSEADEHNLMLAEQLFEISRI